MLINGSLGVVSLVGALILVGCGSKSDEDSSGATVVAPTVKAADLDVSSGCWTAADRAKSSGANAASQQAWTRPPTMMLDANKHYTATLTTNKGAIEVEFFPGDAPKTVNNFICLATAGYYDGTPFHRIISGFMIQGGDPTGTGRGSPGYRFEDEPIKRNYELGTLAMANGGPDTNGSQFFIVVGAEGEQLPKNYTIFGKVTKGMDVVNAIAATQVQPNASGEKSDPIEDIRLENVTISES